MVNMWMPDGSFGQRVPDFDGAAEAGARVGVGHPDAPWGDQEGERKQRRKRAAAANQEQAPSSRMA
jgi:hypothetical protein